MNTIDIDNRNMAEIERFLSARVEALTKERRETARKLAGLGFDSLDELIAAFLETDRTYYEAKGSRR